MLKVTLSTTEFATLDDSLKSEYQLQADGTYKLDLGPNVFTTDKDPSGLMSALEKEREENKRVREVADRLEKEKKDTEMSGIKSVKELREAFTKELEERDRKAAETLAQQQKALAEQREANATRLASEQALKLATELYGQNAAIMLPHVQNRLKGVVAETGETAVQIVDPATGQPTLDQNIETFKNSLSTDPLFKSMVVVSNASGGSANGDGKGSNAPATTKDDGTPKKYSEYKSGELVRLKREQPEKFAALLEAHNS